MNKHVQSMEELQAHLTDQLRFLISSADSFDAGFPGEAKRIATTIRVLVVDTARQTSLLSQLGLKSCLFIDSAVPRAPGSVISYSGLVVSALRVGSPASYMAFLDDEIDGPFKPKPFGDWWEAVVFVDAKGRGLKRKDLVLTMADQDGGAHVDPSLNPMYADLSRNNSLGWMQTDGINTWPMEGPEKAAVRQIGHEVLKTLVPGYSKLPNYPDDALISMSG